MASPYSDVYNIFLSDINDDSLLVLEEADRNNLLYLLLIKSITRFKACKTDLSDRNDNTATFNQTLSTEEIVILATIMRSNWLNDKIYNLEILKQRLVPKDWKMSSQAEHLDKLLKLKQEINKEISKMIVDYTIYAYGMSGDLT